METLINNLVNGNLSEARKGAERFSANKICAALVEYLGYSPYKAARGAVWLKTGKGWQQYCDAK
jgi:hypothetical protein